MFYPPSHAFYPDSLYAKKLPFPARGRSPERHPNNLSIPTLREVNFTRAMRSQQRKFPVVI
ncbi:MAG: hypothetical protein AAGA60_15330 [Cyanobacteria bacterium P01_E01_bin.42]